MKLTIEQNAPVSEVEITIRCDRIDRRLESLIRQIQRYEQTVSGKKDGKFRRFAPDEIFYIESVEERAFLDRIRTIAGYAKISFIQTPKLSKSMIK